MTLGWVLTRLRAATALEFTVGAGVGIATGLLGSRRGALVAVGTKAPATAERDVVGTGDSLISPRHGGV